jgi:hypothetical protein
VGVVVSQVGVEQGRVSLGLGDGSGGQSKDLRENKE